MAKRSWKFFVGVGCGLALLAIAVVVVVVLGFFKLQQQASDRLFEPLLATELEECELIRDGDSLTVRGSIRNGGKGQVESVRISVRWTDASGSVIDEELVDTAPGAWVSPGESREFEQVRADPTGTIDGVVCRIACVTNAEATHCY